MDNYPMEYLKPLLKHLTISSLVVAIIYVNCAFAIQLWDAYTWSTVVIFFVAPLAFLIPVCLKTFPLLWIADIQIAKNDRHIRLNPTPPFRPKLPQ